MTPRNGTRFEKVFIEELKKMQNENKNPIPFNPHYSLTGGQCRDALDALREIFFAYERGQDAAGIADKVYTHYLQLQRKFK